MKQGSQISLVSPAAARQSADLADVVAAAGVSFHKGEVRLPFLGFKHSQERISMQSMELKVDGTAGVFGNVRTYE